MNKKQTRRNFLKSSLVVAAMATTGCSTSKETSKKSLAKTYASMTPEQAKAFRKAWWKKNPIMLNNYQVKACGKWRIHMLGTSAGSEPTPKNNHTSWVLEKPNGELLWFDAGVYCSWTAHNMGLDVLQAKNMFLSHPHADHFIGLADFFTTVNKIRWFYRGKVPYSLNIHTSAPEMVKAGMSFSTAGMGTQKYVNIKPLKVGEIFNDGDVSIEAITNRHMKARKDGSMPSYSFRIKIASIKKSIIFSGDIKSLDDLAPFLTTGVTDLIMLETGHHDAESLCRRLKEGYPNAVKDVLFMHHGRHMRNNREFEEVRAEVAWGKPVIISYDKQTIDFA